VNQDIKSRWVAALRSGEFPQGGSALNKNGKFCCLGVLCELAVHDGVIESLEWMKNSVGYRSPGSIGRVETGILPVDVTYWAGLAGGDPWVYGADGLLHHLSIINDDGVPFTVIANLIEEQL
jgi:hypothetical protein